MSAVAPNPVLVLYDVKLVRKKFHHQWKSKHTLAFFQWFILPDNRPNMHQLRACGVGLIYAV